MLPCDPAPRSLGSCALWGWDSSLWALGSCPQSCEVLGFCPGDTGILWNTNILP